MNKIHYFTYKGIDLWIKYTSYHSKEIHYVSNFGVGKLKNMKKDLKKFHAKILKELERVNTL
jgi:hypothetical protein